MGRPDDLELVERSLERPDRCGITQIVNGKEWVCVKAAHGDPPPLEGAQIRPAYGHHRPSACHYFRRRYPHSDH